MKCLPILDLSYGRAVGLTALLTPPGGYKGGRQDRGDKGAIRGAIRGAQTGVETMQAKVIIHEVIKRRGYELVTDVRADDTIYVGSKAWRQQQKELKDENPRKVRRVR
jgi:hypothetical protein